jgi:hypothetical protein
MKYYIYFDPYGQARGVASEQELAEKYQNDPQVFLRAMCGDGPEARRDAATGHVGVMSFRDKKELTDYLHSLGDEIEGFYTGRSDSRPYNF